ncbi:MAG: hypothetical protein L0H25_04575 [Micrococcales bacterium]|nr:hypothetical protein [Micrococcales bacterium]
MSTEQRSHVVAIDQGSTSTRAVIFDHTGSAKNAYGTGTIMLLASPVSGPGLALVKYHGPIR